MLPTRFFFQKKTLLIPKRIKRIFHSFPAKCFCFSQLDHASFITRNCVDHERVCDLSDGARRAQAVGWPPVRSSRKNIFSVQKTGGGKDDDGKSGAGAAAAFVKVSMDGAPYLRKVDLRMYGSYQELSKALEKMFSSFTIGTYYHIYQPNTSSCMNLSFFIKFTKLKEYQTNIQSL